MRHSPEHALRRLSFSTKFLLRLQGGERVFVKAGYSAGPEGPYLKGRFQRERTCLEVLQGLAVPALAACPEAKVRLLLPKEASWLALRHVPGTRLCDSPLTPAERLGAWLFLAEQLAAFRRHQLLYTDVKCFNTLVTREPLKLTVLDFGEVHVVAPGQTFPANLAFTPGFHAPEQFSGTKHTERSLVFQLGMVLGCSLAGLNSAKLTHPVHGVRRLEQVLHRLGADALARTALACLETDPARRPVNFEATLERLVSGPIPDRPAAVWRILRTPYTARLAEVGL